METKNLIAGVLAITLSVILIATVAVPVINSTQQEMTAVSMENTENILDYMDVAEDDVTIEISYTSGEAQVEMTVGTESHDLGLTAGDSTTHYLFYSDVGTLFINRVTDSGVPIYGFKSTTYTGNLGSVNSILTYDNSTKTLELTVSDSVVFTDEVEKFAYYRVTSDGEFARTQSLTWSVPADVTFEVFRFSGWWANSFVTYTATAEEWANSSTTPIEGMVLSSDSTPTEYAATYTMTMTDNGDGTYSPSANPIYTYNDGSDDVTGTLTTPSFLIPVEYTAYVDNAESLLLGVIPVLLIVAVVFMAVGMIYTKRD